MLITFVQRQKVWAIPMMVSLALSWCLLFCGQLFAASQIAEPHEMPPCHSMMTEQFADEPLSLHELCTGCALEAMQTAIPELPLALLWLHAIIEIAQPELSIGQSSLSLVLSPPYPRTTPLYIEKSALLI